MYKFSIIIVLCFCLGLSIPAIAQYRNQSTSTGTSEYLRSQPSVGLSSLRGLLDPSRMRMSHSVSMGYMNYGGTSATRGLYMNRIDYKISNPVSLTTHFGYQFQPSGPSEWNPATTGQDIVGGADLNWSPSSNSNFRLSFYKGMYPNDSPFGIGRYGYDNYFPGRP